METEPDLPVKRVNGACGSRAINCGGDSCGHCCCPFSRALALILDFRADPRSAKVPLQPIENMGVL